MLSIRTHAVACFVVGQGHVPVGVEYHGPHPVYIFHDEAQRRDEEVRGCAAAAGRYRRADGDAGLSPNMNVQTQVERQIRRRR